MGGLISTFQKLINSKKEQRILLLGLDASGKTTLLYRFRLGEAVTTIPTIGFNVETIQYRNIKLTMWDIGGQQKIRPLWRYYYQGATAIIFVIDSADRARIDEASEELQKLLSEELLENIPVLVFANKQDLPNAMTSHEVVEALGLTSLKNHEWLIQSAISTTGEGIYEGLDWLSRKLQ